MKNGHKIVERILVSCRLWGSDPFTWKYPRSSYITKDIEDCEINTTTQTWPVSYSRLCCSHGASFFAKRTILYTERQFRLISWNQISIGGLFLWTEQRFDDRWTQKYSFLIRILEPIDASSCHCLINLPIPVNQISRTWSVSWGAILYTVRSRSNIFTRNEIFPRYSFV